MSQLQRFKADNQSRALVYIWLGLPEDRNHSEQPYQLFFFFQAVVYCYFRPELLLDDNSGIVFFFFFPIVLGHRGTSNDLFPQLCFMENWRKLSKSCH